MHIVIGSDHAGFELKEKLVDFLARKGMTVTDVGTASIESCDYPDFAFAVATEVVRRERNNESVRGVLLCGSGIGMSIAANKVHGARAALATDKYMAVQGVQHDGANILVVGTRVNSPREIRKIVELFIKASMHADEKYHRRLQKITDYEEEFFKPEQHYSA